MKKSGVWLVALALVSLVMLSACATGGQDSGRYTRAGDFEWERMSTFFNCVIITGYRGNDTDVRIPSQIQGNPVREIGVNAFENKGLTSVTFPQSLQAIGASAFANNQLTEVVIPNSVEVIGESAFANNQLTSVIILDGFFGVYYIGASAFAGNPLLTNIPLSFTERQDLARAEREQAEQAEQVRLAELWRQAGNSLGNLPNTSWHVHLQDHVFGLANTQNRFDFGYGDFLYQVTGTLFGLPANRADQGTFRVSGNTVIFRNSGGEYYSGVLVGNTLTVLDAVFRRVP